METVPIKLRNIFFKLNKTNKMWKFNPLELYIKYIYKIKKIN